MIGRDVKQMIQLLCSIRITSESSLEVFLETNMRALLAGLHGQPMRGRKGSTQGPVASKSKLVQRSSHTGIGDPYRDWLRDSISVWLGKAAARWLTGRLAHRSDLKSQIFVAVGCATQCSKNPPDGSEK